VLYNSLGHSQRLYGFMWVYIQGLCLL